ncbi:cobalamin biosynthesis protein [Streptomyces sp. NPDC057654]|uniref:cobalamin biosynthesis protein n=1 Tax=Streptomyces sp. NPDC057654 TaxID=3346196 RepID=UPI0036812CE4
MTPHGRAPAPTVFVGLGASSGAAAAEVLDLIGRVLAEAGIAPEEVAALATAATKTGEAGLVAAAAHLGVELRGYGAGALARVEVPHPSGAVLAAVGTPSVAEAAALLAAGAGGVLVVGKRKSVPAAGPARVTCAVARGAGGERNGPARMGAPDRK